MLSLSTHLRRRADLAYDGRIPQSEANYIRHVENDEREMRRQLGPIESARQTLTEAWLEAAEAGARHRVAEEAAALNPGDGAARDRLAQARHEFRQSLEWMEDRAAKLRAELHAAAEGRAA